MNNKFYYSATLAELINDNSEPPNPIIDNLIIESANNKLITIRIYSLNGEEVFYNDLHSLNNKLDISSLSSGLYILKINMNNISRKIRIIKKWTLRLYYYLSYFY